MKTKWDYSDKAATYDKRADYSSEAIDELLDILDCKKDQVIADIGAGTGKLSIPLLMRGYNVICVEPNNNMRNIGIQNTKNFKVNWVEGTGENTNMENSSVNYVFFGSSFNVLDQEKALKETKRILKNNGSFACMWNHRDLNDITQKAIENIIKQYIPNYNYGKRREDPTDIIQESKIFVNIRSIQKYFVVKMKTEDIISAWKSHETLSRQSGKDFEKIISDIYDFLKPKEHFEVPYMTKIWCADLT